MIGNLSLLGQDLDDLRLKETVECLCTPQTYFTKVISSYKLEFITSTGIVLLLITIFVNCFSDIYIVFGLMAQVLDTAMRMDVDKHMKKALSRVIITRADTDMKEIKDEYEHLFGVSLAHKIEDTANGNFKDFLLTLIARAG